MFDSSLLGCTEIMYPNGTLFADNTYHLCFINMNLYGPKYLSAYFSFDVTLTNTY